MKFMYNLQPGGVCAGNFVLWKPVSRNNSEDIFAF